MAGSDDEVGEQVEAEDVREAAAQPAEGTNGDAVDVVMPKMGESIIEGTIIAWHKKPGDKVGMDETLLEIATDKVDTEVPSPAEGTLQEILVEEGETVEVGTVIARIGSGSAAPKKKAPEKVAAGESRSGPKAAPTSATATADDVEVAVSETDATARVISKTGSDGRFFSPLVRSIAEKEGLSMRELESIDGSGHGGRLTKKDIVSYLETRKAAPAETRKPEPARATAARAVEATSSMADGRTEIIEMDRMRQIIASHMIESKRTSAHVTSFAEVDVTGLVSLRNARKDAFLEREGVKLTFTPFFVKAAVEALREHPILNSSVEEKRIIVKKDIHVGIAVAIGKTGLVVPVIKNAGDKSITGLARAAADVAERARNKQLQPDDLQGGTFTVTNIGSLGSVMGTPIIPQPQVAILATGAIKKRPVVIEDDRLGDVIAVRQMMYLSLSYDHRIIDGAMASSFLHRMIAELESYTLDSEF
ncbi:MAG: 2-oxoglutarate dehydrogenase, E2 component, dihydrolipoamide succinyltransferase [Rhodothermia bacterium]|nr:2-oxoglutarate dehydrogenase, E2 component, dihydrolipoamide succinyltransferase [Rhodothermia bacterium]